MMNGNDFATAFVIFGLVCAVVGWGVIELVLWLFSFIHITLG